MAPQANAELTTLSTHGAVGAILPAADDRARSCQITARVY